MALYRRGPVWYCRIKNAEGRMIRKALSENKEVAKTILGKMRQDYALQRAGVIPIQPTPEELLAVPRTPRQIYRAYLDRQSMRGKSEAWFASLDLVWRQCVEPHKFTDLRKFTMEHVQQWVEAMKAKGNAGQSINQKASLLKKFCDWAVAQGHMDRSPFTGWESVKLSSQKFRRDLTAEEMARIIAEEDDPEVRLLWLVYAFTGLRKTAGQLLDWSWIAWRERLICLPPHANKSARELRIPLHPKLYEELEARWKALECPTEGSVFRGSLSPLSRFRTACKRAGIDLKGVCLHSIRHTVASRMYEATSGNLKAVQELLGHTSIATTAKYLHVEDGVKRAAVAALAY